MRSSSTASTCPWEGGWRYSEDTAARIDHEIRRALDDAHARVRETPEARRPALSRLAALLIEREVVSRDLLRSILAEPAAA